MKFTNSSAPPTWPPPSRERKRFSPPLMGGVRGGGELIQKLGAFQEHVYGYP